MSTTTTPTATASAEAVHAAAVDNLHRHKRNVAAADAELRQAALTRQALLDRASAGEAVEVSDIRAADGAAKDAEAATALAGAIAAGAERRVHEAQVRVFAAEAADLHAKQRDAVETAILAGRVFDLALREAREKLEAARVALRAVHAGHVTMHQHDRRVLDALAANSALREQHEKDQSTARLPLARAPQPFAARDFGKLLLGTVPPGETFNHGPETIQGYVAAEHGAELPPDRLAELLA